VRRFYTVLGYVLMGIMAVAAVLLLLHYGGIIAAVSPGWLWGFFGATLGVLAGAGILVALADV